MFKRIPRDFTGVNLRCKTYLNSSVIGCKKFKPYSMWVHRGDVKRYWICSGLLISIKFVEGKNRNWEMFCHWLSVLGHILKNCLQMHVTSKNLNLWLENNYKVLNLGPEWTVCLFVYKSFIHMTWSFSSIFCFEISDTKYDLMSKYVRYVILKFIHNI